MPRVHSRCPVSLTLLLSLIAMLQGCGISSENLSNRNEPMSIRDVAIQYVAGRVGLEMSEVRGRYRIRESMNSESGVVHFEFFDTDAFGAETPVELLETPLGGFPDYVSVEIDSVTSQIVSVYDAEE